MIQKIITKENKGGTRGETTPSGGACTAPGKIL